MVGRHDGSSVNRPAIRKNQRKQVNEMDFKDLIRQGFDEYVEDLKSHSGVCAFGSGLIHMRL